MKKLLSLVIAIFMIFCFAACQGGSANEKNKNTDAQYTYLPKTELYTNQNSSGFYREYKNTYKYDDHGNVVKTTEYSKRTFYTREMQYDIEYTYNENGDISKEHKRIENFCTSITDGHQIYEENYNYFYNEKQQLTRKEGPYQSMRSEYEYDEYGNRVKECEYSSDGTKNCEYEYEYDSQNKLTKEWYTTYFGTSSYLASVTDHIYDDDGKLVYSRTNSFSGYKGEADGYSETRYDYDKLDRLIKKESTSINTNGEITNKYVSEYKDFIRLEVKK